jgi:guanylate kinase
VAEEVTNQPLFGQIILQKLPKFLEDFSLEVFNKQGKKSNPQVIIFSGPTGVGKTTILREFEKKTGICRFPNVFTRQARPDDKPDDFIFMSEEEFKSRMKRNEFLQVNQRHGYWHGVLKEEFFRKIREGKLFYMDKSVPSALDLLRKSSDEAVMLTIYILPPDFESLWQRISQRNKDSSFSPHEDKIERLFTSVCEFYKEGSYYDLFLVNDNIERVVKNICSLLAY